MLPSAETLLRPIRLIPPPSYSLRKNNEHRPFTSPSSSLPSLCEPLLTHKPPSLPPFVGTSRQSAELTHRLLPDWLLLVDPCVRTFVCELFLGA